MNDTPAAIATLRAEFQKNAVLPRKQIVAAERFISQLKETMSQGLKPSADDLRVGEKLLQKIENQTQIFMFSAAILAGQEDSSNTELDRKLQAIGEGIDQAESTSTRLRETLKELA